VSTVTPMSRRHSKPLYLSYLFSFAFFLAAHASNVNAATEAQLQSVIDDVPVSKIPGIILLVEGPDISFHGARGYADRKAKKPIKVEHSLRAGSICKTYVAALSIMATDEELIDLDFTIDKYLSADVLNKLPNGLRPTVRQLLNHTSGVPDYYGVRFYLKDWKDRGPLTTELVLHAIRKKKATSIPGTKFSYSNTNYHLLALILEAVYQAPLEALFRERIFEPLDLQETYYNQQFPPGDEIHGYGSPGRPWKDTYEWQENTGPDGGMIAGASDLAVWIRALFSPGGQYSHIGAQMINAPVTEGERKLQGMGVEILQSRSGVNVVGHTGAADGYLTAAFYVQATDTTMVLHMNKSDTKIFGSVLSKIFKIISVH
jgi:D-alanyl-D-alanine carboxypeptidase